MTDEKKPDEGVLTLNGEVIGRITSWVTKPATDIEVFELPESSDFLPGKYTTVIKPFEIKRDFLAEGLNKRTEEFEGVEISIESAPGTIAPTLSEIRNALADGTAWFTKFSHGIDTSDHVLVQDAVIKFTKKRNV